MISFGLWIYAFCLGAIVGSFASVCISRMPRHESIVWPGSHCPGCGAPVRWYDNIPILSFLLLRGRCRHCRGAIGRRYLLLEVLMGVVFAQTALLFGPGFEALRAMVLETLLVIVFFIDLDHRIIPNAITYPGIALGILGAVPAGWGAVAGSVLTAGALGGGLFLVTVLGSMIAGAEAMGLGDVKLAAMIGAFLGWPIGALAILLGIFVGGVVGVVLLASRTKGRRDYVPFGPMLAGGALLALWWGPSLLRWYVSRVAG
ncbi:MAG TPA: prepilin peptidase [bacterium]|nr:prepilin peptidase [bacterium]